jgi:hypothetical protein
MLELPGAIVDSAIKLEDKNFTTTKLNIDIVPISFRYNLNGVIGLGVGPQISLDVSNEVETTSSTDYYTYYNERIGKIIEGASSTTITTESNPFSDIKYGIFGDITIGASRIGPSLGARYIYNFNEPNAQLHFYAIWKI